MSRYEAREQGSGRQAWRVLIDGELQRYPDGRVHIYSRKAAQAAVAALQEAEQAAEQLKATTTVLNPARRRLDGLTHEEAAARGYGPRTGLLCVSATRREVVLVQGPTVARYALHRGEVVGVSVCVVSGGQELYAGTVEALATRGPKGKHAPLLAPWQRLGVGTITRYMAQVS